MGEHEIPGYTIERRDDGWWVARRRGEINEQQRLHGVRGTVLAPTWHDLRSECLAQRIVASWHR